MAGKFVDDADYVMANGVVASKLEKFDDAYRYLLMNREQAWCSMLPNLLFYY